MAKKKEQEQFVVSDRRKFTTEGELRDESSERSSSEQSSSERAVEEPVAAAAAAKPATESMAANAQAKPGPELVQPEALSDESPATPEPPSQKLQDEQHAAYKKSAEAIDSALDALPQENGKDANEVQGNDFEMTFERLIASLYMTALLQLGMARPDAQQQQPQIDIVGARQTIDTLALLNDKTKGNLTTAEANLLQNCLFELRMAYIEIANHIVRPPAPGQVQRIR